jgi:hypothetical protein
VAESQNEKGWMAATGVAGVRLVWLVFVRIVNPMYLLSFIVVPSSGREEKKQFYSFGTNRDLLFAKRLSMKRTEQRMKRRKIVMKKNLVVLALAAIFAVTVAGEAMAGKGGGGGRSGAGNTSVTRPEGSQRRDGSFATTGTTANGSATRPDRGNGLRDGSRLAAPVPAE